MIRQGRNRAHKNISFQVENYVQFDQTFDNHQPSQDKKVFEDGIFTKFFDLNINNKNSLFYTSKCRKTQLNNKNNLSLKIQGHRTKTQQADKENFLDKTLQRPQNQSKMIFLQTTGNAMRLLKTSESRPRSQRDRRPISAATSYRDSSRGQNIDQSISKILQELSQNLETKKKNEKISTSKALVLFSKVIRNNEKPSKEFFKKRIHPNDSNRYQSVSILANKAKIQSKDSKRKVDFKTYLQNFKLSKETNSKSNILKSSQKPDQFAIGAWDTAEVEFF